MAESQFPCREHRWHSWGANLQRCWDCPAVRAFWSNGKWRIAL